MERSATVLCLPAAASTSSHVKAASGCASAAPSEPGLRLGAEALDPVLAAAQRESESGQCSSPCQVQTRAQASKQLFSEPVSSMSGPAEVAPAACAADAQAVDRSVAATAAAAAAASPLQNQHISPTLQSPLLHEHRQPGGEGLVRAHAHASVQEHVCTQAGPASPEGVGAPEAQPEVGADLALAACPVESSSRRGSAEPPGLLVEPPGPLVQPAAQSEEKCPVGVFDRPEMRETGASTQLQKAAVRSAQGQAHGQPGAGAAAQAEAGFASQIELMLSDSQVLEMNEYQLQPHAGVCHSSDIVPWSSAWVPTRATCECSANIQLSQFLVVLLVQSLVT